MTFPAISIVIPAFNEARRLGTTLAQITTFLTARADEWEVIVVDDGSQDETAQVVADFATTNDSIRLLGYAENRGKGYAVRYGILASRFATVLVTDADLSTPIAELEKLYPLLADADVVIGSRSVSAAEVQKKQGRFRNLCGKVFNVIIRLLGLTPFGDTQCGFKLWKREAAQKIFPLCCLDGFAIDVEALLLASRAGLCIKEVGVLWRNSPESKVRIFADSLTMFVDVLSLRWRIGADRHHDRAEEE